MLLERLRALAEVSLTVIEDDDLVDAEDSEGAGDLACEGGFEVVGLGAGGGQ